MNLVIDFEFQHHLPPLHVGGKEELEALIKEAGKARDALIVWDEANILVDGHHRYEICTRLNLPFTVERVSFPSRAAALLFAQRQQFARRNQEKNWLDYLRGVRYRAERQAHGGQIPGSARIDNESQEPCPSITADKIAQEAGVHANTVKRASWQ